MKIKGFTLTEILVAVVIIATLAALAWPNYMAIKEKSLNREAKASLALIRAAEKIYKLEQGFYYPDPATSTEESNASLINNYLKLGLPESATVSWSIKVNSTLGAEFSRATRTNSEARKWEIDISDDAGDSEPVCSGSSTNCL